MKKIFYLLILIFIAGCAKDDDLPEPEEPIGTVTPGNGKKILFQIDEKYNFTGYKAVTILDTTKISGDSNAIFIPKDFNSLLVVTDENSEEILAVIETDFSKSEIILNAETVAFSLLDVLPLYNDLSPVEQRDFQNHLKAIESFLDFKSMVNHRLEERKPIYASDPAFLSSLLEINVLIKELYYNDGDAERNRNFIKQSENTQFSDWLILNEKKIENQILSYVLVQLTSTTNSDSYQELLDPTEIVFWSEDPSLSLIDIKENCYQAVINQDTPEVKEKNLRAAAGKLVQLIMGKVFKMDNSGGGMGHCYSSVTDAIMGSGTGGLSALILNHPSGELTTPILASIVELTRNVAVAAYQEESCYSNFVSAKTWSKLAVSRFILIFSLIDAAYILHDSAQLVGFIKGYVKPVTLSEKFQILQDKILPGCLEIKLVPGSLKEENFIGEEVAPMVKLSVVNSYAPIKLNGFQIKWKIGEDQGSVSPATSLTDSVGNSFTTWSLPEIEGDYEIEAKLIDGDGDHLNGSPVILTTKVKPASLLGKWSLETYNGDALGENYFYVYGNRNCPSIATEKRTLVSDVLQFNESGFMRRRDYNIVLFRLYFDNNCNIINDLEDEEEEGVGYSEGNFYRIEGNIIFSEDYFDNPIEWSFKFLPNGNLEITDGSNVGVYKRI